MKFSRKPATPSESPVLLAVSLMLLAVTCCSAKSHGAHAALFPKLQAGQTLTYQIRYHSEKQVKTQSAVIFATPAQETNVDVNVQLRLEVLAVRAQGDRAVIRARSALTLPSADSQVQHHGAPLADQPQNPAFPETSLEFTILPDGRLDDITGLDALTPDQQQAWQEWTSRFLLATAFPSGGIRVAQKWSSQEPEKSPAPLAGLRWVRESTYVRDEPCRVVVSTASAQAEPEMCAVILTTATLKQASSAKNSTPEQFKLRELRTAGTARGRNHIITYISLKSGVLMRATEEATQEMNVTVAKADASNRVHYDVNATSRSEVLLVASDTPPARP